MSKSALFWPAVFMLAVFFACPHALSKPEHKQNKDYKLSTKGPCFGSMVDGQAAIAKMQRQADLLNDYSFEYEITVFKDSTDIQEHGKLYFKKPKLMRMEELGPYRHGSLVVVGKDGKARGHLGGLLKWATMTLNADNNILRAANGYPMKDSDLTSLANFLQNWLDKGIASARVTEAPVTITSLSQPVKVIEMYDKAKPELVLKRIFIDADTYLPVRWEDFDYDYHSLTIWRNIETNQGLEDALFEP